MERRTFGAGSHIESFWQGTAWLQGASAADRASIRAARGAYSYVHVRRGNSEHVFLQSRTRRGNWLGVSSLGGAAVTKLAETERELFTDALQIAAFSCNPAFRHALKEKGFVQEEPEEPEFVWKFSGGRWAMTKTGGPKMETQQNEKKTQRVLSLAEQAELMRLYTNGI